MCINLPSPLDEVGGVSTINLDSTSCVLTGVDVGGVTTAADGGEIGDVGACWDESF